MSGGICLRGKVQGKCPTLKYANAGAGRPIPPVPRVVHFLVVFALHQFSAV